MSNVSQKDIRNLVLTKAQAALTGNVGELCFVTDIEIPGWFKFKQDATLTADADVLAARFNDCFWVRVPVGSQDAVDAWAVSTDYDVGDVAKLSDFVMICITAHTSSAVDPVPDSDLVNWHLVAIKPPAYALRFTSYFPSGTVIGTDGTTDGSTPIAGITVENVSLLATKDVQLLLDLGFMFLLNGTDITATVTPDPVDKPNFTTSVFIDDGDVLEIAEYSKAESISKIDFSTTSIVSPSEVDIVTVSTAGAHAIDDTYLTKAVEYTAASEPVIATGLASGWNTTLINTTAAPITITGPGVTFVGDINIAANSAVTVMSLGSDRYLVVGGVA